MLYKQLYIQCKCSVNSYFCVANSCFVFWNFLKTVFNQQFIDPSDAEPVDTQG